MQYLYKKFAAFFEVTDGKAVTIRLPAFGFEPNSGVYETVNGDLFLGYYTIFSGTKKDQRLVSYVNN